MWHSKKINARKNNLKRSQWDHVPITNKTNMFLNPEFTLQRFPNT